MSLVFILSPINCEHNIEIYDKKFKTMLHYLYYYCYAKDETEKNNILEAESPEILLGYNYQLHDLQCSIDDINKYVYTGIAYMYCIYKDFRNCLNNMDKNINLKYIIPNDRYFGVSFNKYAKAIISFKNNII